MKNGRNITVETWWKTEQHFGGKLFDATFPPKIMEQMEHIGTHLRNVCVP